MKKLSVASTISQDACASRKYVECASTDFLYNIQNDEVIDQPGRMGEQQAKPATSPPSDVVQTRLGVALRMCSAGRTHFARSEGVWGLALIGN